MKGLREKGGQNPPEVTKGRKGGQLRSCSITTRARQPSVIPGTNKERGVEIVYLKKRLKNPEKKKERKEEERFERQRGNVASQQGTLPTAFWKGRRG